MWPRFDAMTRRPTWVELLVSLLWCERFFPEYRGFPLLIIIIIIIIIIIRIIIIITLFMSQVHLAEHRGSTNWGDRKSNQHKSSQIKGWFLVRGKTGVNGEKPLGTE